MYVYKANIQSYGSLDKLKLRIVVRGDLKNKETIGDIWYSTESMRTLKYYLSDDYNNTARENQLYFIVSLQQDNVKHRVFVNSDRRHGDYLPQYCNYFGRTLRPNK